MTIKNVSNAKYIHIGIIMIILCSCLISIFVSYFESQVKYSEDYDKDTCIISNITLVNVLFNCWSDTGNVNVVTLPCVLIYVNTTKFPNVIFYRSMQDKLFVKYHNVECSYIPSACENDPAYLETYLKNSLFKLFPPPFYSFECFFSKNVDDSELCENCFDTASFNILKHSRFLAYSNMDALLYLPDRFAYNLCLAVVIFGLVLSAGLILFAYISIRKSNSRHKYDSLFNSTSNDENFFNYLKKVLDEAHINYEDVIHKEINIDVRNNDDTVANTPNNIDTNEPVVADLETEREDTITLSGRSYMSAISSKSRLNIKSDMKVKPSKLKLGNSEYHIGRIEYRVNNNASNARLSRHNSNKSLNTVGSFSPNETGNETRFYLGTNDDESGSEAASLHMFNNADLHIPDAILEEDERYLTINKKLTDEKIKPVNEIFYDMPKSSGS